MGDMDWKIWGIKLLKGAGLTALTGALVYVADYIDVTEFPPEYAFYAGLAYTILSQIGNYIKHTFMI